MRILQAFEPASGGVPVHVHALTEKLIERGHTVDVILSRHGDQAPEFARLGSRVIEADLVPEIFAWRANVRAFRQLVRAMRRGRYDVVHVHGAKAATLGRPAALLARTPTAYSSHAWVYRTQDKRERGARRARRALTLGIERALGPLTGAIVCVSQDEREAALEDRIAREKRLRIAYYGVPIDGKVDPDPRLAEFRGDGPLFGFMARLQEQKGLPLLLGALRTLRDRGTLPRFAIVGSGPDEAWFRDQLAAEGFGDRVLLTPFEPPVWPKLAAFDVYVLSSYWEALPIGILEAMSAGLPVVATAVNGVPEAVADGESGLLVSPDDPAGLADAVERLAADAELRKRMGQSGRRRIEERFTLDAMTDSIEAIYRELVER
jgi:glycosyltransferase involved in cell wall biosynthesis